MYKIKYAQNYTKRVIKFFKNHQNLYPKYKKTILLLEKDPYHPSLRLHKLKGKLKPFFSVSINLQYRIVIDFIIVDKTIILIDIGDHSIYD